MTDPTRRSQTGFRLGALRDARGHLGLAGVQIELGGSRGPAHRGTGGTAGSMGWHSRAVVRGPCMLSPARWRMQGHKLKQPFPCHKDTG